MPDLADQQEFPDIQLNYENVKADGKITVWFKNGKKHIINTQVRQITKTY